MNPIGICLGTFRARIRKINPGPGSENLANRSFLFCIPNRKLQRTKHGFNNQTDTPIFNALVEQK
jgi:hypothetical protein